MEDGLPSNLAARHRATLPLQRCHMQLPRTICPLNRCRHKHHLDPFSDENPLPLSLPPTLPYFFICRWSQHSSGRHGGGSPPSLLPLINGLLKTILNKMLKAVRRWLSPRGRNPSEDVISTLPDSCLVLIAQQLDATDLNNLALTNKCFLGVVRSVRVACTASVGDNKALLALSAAVARQTTLKSLLVKCTSLTANPSLRNLSKHASQSLNVLTLALFRLPERREYPHLAAMPRLRELHLFPATWGLNADGELAALSALTSLKILHLSNLCMDIGLERLHQVCVCTDGAAARHRPPSPPPHAPPS